MSNKQFITANELVGHLKMDSSLLILFVEGLRDLSFWRKYAPINNRMNSVVYSASLINITTRYEGGEKGKLLKLLDILKSHKIDSRVKVFVDSDNDRLLGNVHSHDVIMTDFRDLESYAYNEHTLSEVVHTGLAKDHVIITSLKEGIEELCIPIASLRLLSEKEGYLLPFTRTLKNNNRKKYIKKKGGKYFVDIESLINTLLQNAGISLSKANEIRDKLKNTIKQLKSYDIRQTLHGKDWVFFLAYLCDETPSVIEPLIFLGIDYKALDSNPNIASVKEYLLGHPI